MRFEPGKCYAPRMVVLLAVLLTVAAVGLGIGVAYAADARLDLADDSLENAAALLEASQAGPVDAKTQKEFDKAIARALSSIAEARVDIADAKSAVDNP